MVGTAKDKPTEFSWQGRFILLLAFASNLLTAGVYKSLGVLLPTLRDQFTTHTWVIGIVASIYSASSVVTGLAVRPWEVKIGTRKLLVGSSTAVAIGLMIVSLASTPKLIALAILSGPCTGVLCILGQTLLGRHFTEHQALAFGLGNSGSAIALVTFAPLTQLFLDTYGWRGAMLLLAAICGNIIPCAALIKDTKGYVSVPERDVDELTEKGVFLSLKAFFVDLYKKIDVEMLLQFKFVILLCARMAPSFTYSSWVVYYVPHLQAKGISPEVAASLCSAAAVGYFVGAFIWAPFIDRGHIRTTTAHIISCFGISLSFIVDYWLESAVSFAVAVFVFGLSLSATYTVTDVLMKELFGVDRLPNTFAWVRSFLVAPILLAGFVSGWIHDAVGSYDLAFFIIGSVPVVASLPMIIGIIMKLTH